MRRNDKTMTAARAGKLLLTAVVMLTMLMTTLPGRAMADAKTLVVRADMWMPYNGEPNATRPGFMIEILREVFEPQGVRVDYDLMPWSRALEECKRGAIDAIVGAGEDRKPNYVFPEEEIGFSGGGWLVRKDFQWEFTGIDSLASVRLGLNDTYTYDAELDAYAKAHRESDRVQMVSGDDAVEKQIKKLLSHRIDVFYEDPAVMLWEVTLQNATDKVRMATLDPVEKFERVFLGLSKEKPESAAHAALFDAGVRALRASGRLAEIMAAYGLEDWKGQLPR